MDRELLQDSDGVNESFWDGLGVEFEARYFLEGMDSDGINESFWDGLGVEFEAKYIFDFKGAPGGGNRGRSYVGGDPAWSGRSVGGYPLQGVPPLPHVVSSLGFGVLDRVWGVK